MNAGRTIFLETERTILRPLADTEADGALLMELDSDPAVMRYIGSYALGSVESYRERIRPYWLPNASQPRGFWAVIEKPSEQFLGWFFLRPAPEYRFAKEAGWSRASDIEIGYRLRQSAWGRGVATEVASRLVPLTLGNPQVTCVVACALVTNRGSTRVMEKVGMTLIRDFSLADYADPIVMYAICRDGCALP